MSKIVNLEEYKGKMNKNIASMKKDNQECESIYDRVLRNMTAEDYKMIEELFEN